MLREWRRLHELSWDPSDLPEREFNSSTAKRNHAVRLDEFKKLGGPAVEGPRKGGPRGKERLFSIENGLSRLTHNKAARKKIIQDQKANSVADLAAVLLEQDNMREKSQVKRKETEKLYKDKLWKEVQDLYKEMTTQDGLGMVQADLAAAERNLESVAPTQNEDASRRRTRGSLKKEIRQLRQRRDKFMAITKVTDVARRQADQDAKDALKKIEDEASAANRKPTEAEIKQANTLAEVDMEFVLRLNLSQIASNPVFGEAHELFKQATGPLQFDYTSEGVRVRWSTFTDNEYAEQWPDAVVHENLGLSRHTMPDPEEQPLLDIENKFVYEVKEENLIEADEYDAWRYLMDEKAAESVAPGGVALEDPVYTESNQHRKVREMRERSAQRAQAREQLAEEHQEFLAQESEAKRESRERKQEAAVKRLPFKQRLVEEKRESAKYEVFSERFEKWRARQKTRGAQEGAQEGAAEEASAE